MINWFRSVCVGVAVDQSLIVTLAAVVAIVSLSRVIFVPAVKEFCLPSRAVLASASFT
jgi:hypothetical protein